ncbi:hypothetical protein F5Y08DRAFT_336743 [Xylaria arbuscula]|nr:hypothetical protein F5Y08DRAFT_336743 [Xylaria arbuscula]
MGLISSIRKDVRLRNLTIYAQWSGVLAGIILGILYAWGFLEASFRYPKRWTALGSGLGAIIPITRVINKFVLPWGPCFLEIPHLHIRFPWMVTFHYAWLSFILLTSSLSSFIGHGPGITIISFMQVGFLMWSGAFAMIQALIVGSRRDMSHRWDRLRRVWYYTLFGIANLTSLTFPFIRHSTWRPFIWYNFLFGLPSIPAALSFTAAILYFVAVLWEHGFVFSLVLGGSGVEPMDFTIPGSGPALNSIGGEGSIRL